MSYTYNANRAYIYKAPGVLRERHAPGELSLTCP
jgi:hypothetical protein